MPKAISLKMMIFMGFGLVLGLLIALAGTALRGTSSIGNDFTDYRQAARESVMVNGANELLLRARLAVMQFRVENSSARVETVFGQLANLRTLKDELTDFMVNDERAAEIAQLSSLTDRYESAFQQVVALQDQRNLLVPQLNTSGRDARSFMSQIMESAYGDNDAEAAYYGGVVQQHVMLSRYYAEVFLLHNAAEDLERAWAEYELANQNAETLNASLQNPGRRALLGDFTRSWSTFADVFEQLSTTIEERNAIRDGQLDAIGPQMASGYGTVLAAVELEQDTIGPRAAAEVASVTRNMWIIGIVAVIFGAVAAFLVGNTVSRSISRVVGRMKELANGELEATIENTDRKDELGDMARALVVFQDNAHEKQRLESEQAATLARADQEKRQAMDELADGFESSVEEVVGAVTNAAEKMVHLAESMSAAAGRASERSSTVASASSEASMNVETVAAASEEMTNSIAEVSQRIGQTASMTDEAAKSAEATTQTVSQLANSAQTVGEVISLISAIAEQTNLLALNATIEAARAGDAGKGFAVVANEVKSLANQTAKATEQISTQITGMQGETEAVVDAIDKIGTMIQDLNGTSTSIAAAVDEQHSATQEIARNTQKAADGTREVSSNISQVSSAVQETGEASAEVLAASSQVAAEAVRLRESVSKFLTSVRAA